MVEVAFSPASRVWFWAVPLTTQASVRRSASPEVRWRQPRRRPAGTADGAETRLDGPRRPPRRHGAVRARHTVVISDGDSTLYGRCRPVTTSSGRRSGSRVCVLCRPAFRWPLGIFDCAVGVARAVSVQLDRRCSLDGLSSPASASGGWLPVATASRREVPTGRGPHHECRGPRHHRR